MKKIFFSIAALAILASSFYAVSCSKSENKDTGVSENGASKDKPIIEGSLCIKYTVGDTCMVCPMYPPSNEYICGMIISNDPNDPCYPGNEIIDPIFPPDPIDPNLALPHPQVILIEDSLHQIWVSQVLIPEYNKFPTNVANFFEESANNGYLELSSGIDFDGFNVENFSVVEDRIPIKIVDDCVVITIMK